MNRSDYNLAQWLEWMEQNHPTEIDLGLARVAQVFQRMNLDLSASKIISIAGTNGKGTTTAFLESIYLASDYTTLAYTSPHMLHYNERVRLNGVNVVDDLLIAAFNAIDRAMGQDNQRISLSYFEIGTLAAIYLISVQRPQVALLEVGLGGRLDAVNIIDAHVSVITTLAIDHIDWLGDDIEQIGREKAGIARSGRPLICGELTPPNSIAEISNEQNFLLYQAGKAFSFNLDKASNTWSWSGLDANDKPLVIERLAVTNLPVQNAATALQVIAKAGLDCPLPAIVSGLENARALGRLQSVSYSGKTLLLDVAHNPQSANYLTKMLLQQIASNKQTTKVHFVLGVLADKDCKGLINELMPVAAHWHLVPLDVARGQSSEQLQQIVVAQGVDVQSVSCYHDMQSALDMVTATVTDEQLIVVAGSFFTVTAALNLL
ncbi:bifunctional tetrahydrofolate synthase/dihydrofolate synthase [Gammaproteobacteria bacterium AS21]